MRINRTESGLYVPSTPQSVKGVRKNLHENKGLQVWSHQHYLAVSHENGDPISDRYVLVNVYDVRGYVGLNNGFHVYPGDGQTWGSFNAKLMTKEQVEERLEYYKENDFCEYT